MRPIDADALEEELVSHKYKYSPYLHFLDVAVTIERMPTIDAVPVVNCINCTQMEIQGETTNCHTKSCCFCKKWKSPVSPVGFCNFGERKDDE